MKRILLITLGLSLFLCADFTRDANGIVTDSTTTLQWQDDVFVDYMNWEESILYCEALDLDGKGWRLPNINELQTIIDDSKWNPAIVDGFINTYPAWYWSSTTVEGIRDHVHRVDFRNGAVSYSTKGGDVGRIRCVRGGQR